MSILVKHPVALPTTKIPPSIDAAVIASSFLPHLPNLLSSHFTKDAVWRDIFALTGTLRTFYSPASVLRAWKDTTSQANPISFVLDEDSAKVVRLPTENEWIDVRYTFETTSTPKLECSLMLNLVLSEEGQWKIWVMRTILDQMKDQPNIDSLDPAEGDLDHVHDTNATNGHHGGATLDVIIIGGGQAGLSAGGRMKALGLSYAVLDKHSRVGDSWGTRYASARLHTTREYSHLPFGRTFPDTYQEWLTKDDLAEGHRRWVEKFGINVWTNSTLVAGVWVPNRKEWVLNVIRERKECEVRAKFVVLAGGAGGQVSRMPKYPNREVFQGKVLHSVSYSHAKEWRGKHGIIIGTANTAHDVAEDMVDAGLASVTMIQRSRTYVLPVEYYKKAADANYNAHTPTETADRNSQTSPFAVIDLITQSVLHYIAKKDPARFDALEHAGFNLERYGSVTHCLYERQGGHYMDVGASKKIADGLIKVNSKTLPVKYVPSGLEMSDGSILPADIIVFATGFHGNMRYMTESIFGPEVASQAGDFWHLDDEGELIGAFKPTGHEGLFYHGGTIGQARYYCRFIAIQIKARLLGTPLRVYNESP